MKKIRKNLIFTLCILMVLFSKCVVFASQDDIFASVFFASDYQFYKQYTPELFGDSISSCRPIIEKFAKIVKEANHNIETVVIGGDYTQNDGMRNPQSPTDTSIFGTKLEYHYGNTPNISMSEIKRAFDSNFSDVSFIFAQGNHDPDTSVCSELALTGPHEFDNYIIYVLNDEDFVGSRPRVDNYDSEYSQNRIVPGSISKIYDAKSKILNVSDALDLYLKDLIEKKDCRPIFICSHQPIHFNTSNYNGNGYLIFDAINENAKKLDIVYLFAHTHEGVDDIGGGLSYVGKGCELKIANDTLCKNGFEAKKINFTYLNYGFLAYYKGQNAIISSTVADIAKNTIELKRYGAKSGTQLQAYSIKRINPLVEKVVNVENNKDLSTNKTDDKVIVFTIGSKIVNVFGEKIENDVAPIIVNDRTMLPTRLLAEKMGATVAWDEKAQKITVKKDNVEIIMFIGKDTVTVNNKEIILDCPVFIENDRTYTPLRLIAENLGATVEWNSESEQVIISIN